MEHESDGDTICNGCAWYSHQTIGTKTGGHGNKRPCGDHPNYSFVEIGQNIYKCPGDLSILDLTHTPVENLEPTLGWKTFKRVK